MRKLTKAMIAASQRTGLARPVDGDGSSVLRYGSASRMEAKSQPQSQRWAVAGFNKSHFGQFFVAAIVSPYGCLFRAPQQLQRLGEVGSGPVHPRIVGCLVHDVDRQL